MRIEQILTLLNADDGIYRHSNKMIIKKSSSISIIDEEDNSSLISILKPEIKLASKKISVDVVMPSAISKKYSHEELQKISSTIKTGKSIEDKVQQALVYLASGNRPMPDVQSMVSLASMMNNDQKPGILTLRFAQWGGQGGMSGNETGSFSSFSFQTEGDTDQFYGNGWRSQTMFDSVLDSARKNDRVGEKISTEKKLENVGFYNHKYADENALKYTMSWSDRIKHKNLQRLRRMFQQREAEKDNQNKYSPEWLRTMEPLDPAHYESPETALNARRETEDKGRDYRFQRLLENTPDWHGKLPPIGPGIVGKHPHQTKWDTLRRYSSLSKKSKYTFEEGSAPSRRSEHDNHAGGISGAFGNESRYMDQIVDPRETTENEPFVGNEDYLEQYMLNKEHLGLINRDDMPHEETNSKGISPTDKVPMFDFQTMTIEEALRKVREKERGLDKTDYTQGAEDTTENDHATSVPIQTRWGPPGGVG